MKWIIETREHEKRKWNENGNDMRNWTLRLFFWRADESNICSSRKIYYNIDLFNLANLLILVYTSLRVLRQTKTVRLISTFGSKLASLQEVHMDFTGDRNELRRYFKESIKHKMSSPVSLIVAGPRVAERNLLCIKAQLKIHSSES